MADNSQAIEWFLARDGQQHGPVSAAEFQKIIDLGYLKPTDLVWRQGWEEWRSASTVLPKPSPQPHPATPAPSQPAAAKPAPQRPVEAEKPAAPEQPLAHQASAERRPEPEVYRNPTAAAAADNHEYPVQPEPAPRPVNPNVNKPAAQSGYGAPRPASDGRDQAAAQMRGPGAPNERGDWSRGPSLHPAPQPGSMPEPAMPQTARVQPGQPSTGEPRNTGSHGPAPHGPQAGGSSPRWDVQPGHRDARPAGANAGPGGPQPYAGGPGAYSGPGVGPGAAAPQPGRVPAPDTAPKDRRFPWRSAAVFVLLAGLGGGSFMLYKNGKLASLPFLNAPGRDGQVPNVAAPATAARQTTAGSALTAAPPATSTGDLGSPLWQLLKRDYPDWYNERVSEMAQLTSQSKNRTEISIAMTRALVDLRRKHNAEALKASPGRLAAIAQSFVGNLNRLSQHSTAACYGFISQGETSPAVTSIASPEQRAAVEAQLATIFEAAAEGRRSPKTYEQPKREDYDALTAELGKRGWSAADLQLFSDARALARAAPEKVCQMVNDWFSAQLAVKDEAVRTRLLTEALKPVVAG